MGANGLGPELEATLGFTSYFFISLKIFLKKNSNGWWKFSHVCATLLFWQNGDRDASRMIPGHEERKSNLHTIKRWNCRDVGNRHEGVQSSREMSLNLYWLFGVEFIIRSGTEKIRCSGKTLIGCITLPWRTCVLSSPPEAQIKIRIWLTSSTNARRLGSSDQPAILPLSSNNSCIYWDTTGKPQPRWRGWLHQMEVRQ